MNIEEMEQWLKRIPVLTAPRNPEEELNINELLLHPGLPILLGLLFGSRQAFYAQLSYQPLKDDDGSWRAAVLQGKIQGIELVVQTVKELAVPVSTDAPNKEPV